MTYVASLESLFACMDNFGTRDKPTDRRNKPEFLMGGFSATESIGRG